MYCSKCGTQCNEGELFCKNCGNSLQNNLVQSNNQVEMNCEIGNSTAKENS